MSIAQLPGELVSILEWTIADILRQTRSGVAWDVAVGQSLKGILLFAPEIAKEVLDEVEASLLVAGESFLKLASVHVQSGYEKVTGEDTAREKAGADLAKSGDALPEN